jgi:hypothetical protein
MMLLKVTPEGAWIFRIVHADNVAWILKHGLHCKNSSTRDPNYRSIGNADLIENRSRKAVPISPGGTLSDYIPFYFTPRSPMLLNIRTGRNVPKVPSDEIVILVSSLPHLQQLNVAFVFTDRHAYLQSAQFFGGLSYLGNIDWAILRRSDFKSDPEDPEKLERYRAEALIHRQVPTSGLLGIACYNEQVHSNLKASIASQGVDLKTIVRPDWYC